MVSGALLSFSLTPVQSFIEAARTVRDLKAGSRILAHLIYQAYKACSVAGAEALYPMADKSNGEPQSIPNQFVMLFPDVEKARACDPAGAVQKRWEEIAATVHNALKGEFSKHCADWDADWGEQIEKYWECTTVVVPLAEVTQEALEALFGQKPGTVGLAEQWDALQAVFNAKKEVRNFPGDHGIGRHKCAILGDLEHMGPTGLGNENIFWGQVEGFSRDGIWLNDRDRLCAVSLVKRFAKLDSELKDLEQRIPDTAAIATAAWWADADTNNLARTECVAFETEIGYIEDQIGNEAETARRYLLMEDLSAKAVAKGTKWKDNPDHLKQAAAKLKTARDALLGKTKRLGAPPRYLAILALDGDHMGRWLSGDKLADRAAVTPDYYKTMSTALQEYAGKVAQIVDEHHGTLIYAGGDDILALLPISTVLDCARTLQEKFPEFGKDSDGKPPTASAGIGILHYMQDLRSGLRVARDAEKAAKGWGRDALGIGLMKRSGGDIDILLEWTMVETMQKLQALFECGVSDRWVYRLLATQPSIPENLEPDAAGLLIDHATLRMELPRKVRDSISDAGVLALSDKPKDDVRGFIVSLWDEVTDALDKRHAQLQAGRADAAKTWPKKSDSGFTQRSVEAFCNLCLTASFLGRGREQSADSDTETTPS